jgi:hypothetical protein
LPTVGGRALATRVAGLLLVDGAILIVVTVALPPAAEGSDLLILGCGAVAAVAGVWLLLTPVDLRGGADPEQLGGRAERLSASRRAGVTVHWARDSGTGNSDHREFELAGLPGAVLEVWKGVFPCHHMACDRPRLLQKLAMKRATRILEELCAGSDQVQS